METVFRLIWKDDDGTDYLSRHWEASIEDALHRAQAIAVSREPRILVEVWRKTDDD